MRLVAADQSELGLEHVIKASPAGPAPTTVTVTGEVAPERELVIPYRDQQLRGDTLLGELDDWVGRGIIEPSCARGDPGRRHPSRVAGPARPDGGGARRRGRGRATVGPAQLGRQRDRRRPAQRPALVARPGDGPAQRGHAEGPGHRVARGYRVTPASRPGPGPERGPRPGRRHPDGRRLAGHRRRPAGLGQLRLRRRRRQRPRGQRGRRPHRPPAGRPPRRRPGFPGHPDRRLCVPPEAVAESCRRFAARPMAAKLARATTGGRLFKQAYVQGAATAGEARAGGRGINDSFIAQQGPNYALAKRLQRWRATPPATTAPRSRSTWPRRPRPDRSPRTAPWPPPTRAPPLRSGSLRPRHDPRPDGRAPGPRPLRRDSPARAHPWQDEAHAAAHGGLWRIPYAPRSALPVAAMLGYPASPLPAAH